MKKRLFHQNHHFGNVLLSHDDDLPNTKMVRMVNRHLFYNRDLKIVIEKGSYGGKLKFSRALKIEKSVLGSKIGLLRVVLRSK